MPRSILVSSASPTEGKSTTVSNLANVFAEAGSRVTLVDGDLRRPNLHRIFGLDRERGGLTSMLVGKQELNGLGVQQTSQDNLVLLSSGPLPPRPADLLGSSRMKELVGHYVAYRKLVSPSPSTLLPKHRFRLYAVCARYPHNLSGQVPWQKQQAGVYHCRWGTDVVRVTVAGAEVGAAPVAPGAAASEVADIFLSSSHASTISGRSVRERMERRMGARA